MILVKHKSLVKYKAFYKQCSGHQLLLLVANYPEVSCLEEQMK